MLADQKIETCGFSLNEKGEKVYNKKELVPYKGQKEEAQEKAEEKDGEVAKDEGDQDEDK